MKVYLGCWLWRVKKSIRDCKSTKDKQDACSTILRFSLLPEREETMGILNRFCSGWGIWIKS